MDMNSRALSNVLQNGAPVSQQVGAYNTYVGARYVPIFDGDWDATKQYEPLVIVTSGGDSYTSKQYVPAGIPVTNENFWAHTGNWNGQLESLRQEVINNSISINELDTKVEHLDNDYWLFIADSWGDTLDDTIPGWPTTTASLMKLNGNYTICQKSGSGIIQGSPNYYQMVQELDSNIKGKVTQIVMETAANDLTHGYDIPTITNSYNNFVNLCKLSFPNLKRIVALPMVFNLNRGAYSYNPFYNIFVNNMDTCVPQRCPSWAHNCIWYKNDGHLNANGNQLFSQAIANYLLGNDTGVQYGISNLVLNVTNFAGNLFTSITGNLMWYYLYGVIPATSSSIMLFKPTAGLDTYLTSLTQQIILGSLGDWYLGLSSGNITLYHPALTKETTVKFQGCIPIELL